MSGSTDLVESVRDQAREVGRGWSGPGADADWTLVAALFDGLAADDGLLRLAAEIPAERLPALLFVAAVQRVVADHGDDPLAAYYPGPDQRDVDVSFRESLRAFVEAHADEVRSCFDRRYQMNEVGRSVQVALALGVIQAHDVEQGNARPLALIDVGAAAGFGLHVDRYHVDLGDGRGFGPTDSPVQLSCTTVGYPPVPASGIHIGSRLGLDAAPIDLHDHHARDWLQACTPPTVASLARLDGAVDIARRFDTPVRRIDDPFTAIGDAIDAIPSDQLVVVVDSYTAVFVDDDERQAWRSAILGRGRDAAWISLDPLVPLGTDADRSVQGLPVDPAVIELNRSGGVFALLSFVASIGGSLVERALATAHPSGTRMTWLDIRQP